MNYGCEIISICGVRRLLGSAASVGRQAVIRCQIYRLISSHCSYLEYTGHYRSHCWFNCPRPFEEFTEVCRYNLTGAYRALWIYEWYQSAAQVTARRRVRCNYFTFNWVSSISGQCRSDRWFNWPRLFEETRYQSAAHVTARRRVRGSSGGSSLLDRADWLCNYFTSNRVSSISGQCRSDRWFNWPRLFEESTEV